MRTRATSTVLAATLLLTLTGCGLFAEQTTQKAYDPSDGFGTAVGDIAIRNALLISDDGGETASLAVNVINSGVENITMVVSWDGAQGTTERNVYLAPKETLKYGAETNQIVLNDIGVEPGALFPIYFQYGQNEGKELLVPVLDGTLPEYSDLVPLSAE